MPHYPKQTFHRADRVRLRTSYGSLPVGAIGIVYEVFWSAEQCSVDFGDGEIVIVPWRLLELYSGEV